LVEETAERHGLETWVAKKQSIRVPKSLRGGDSLSKGEEIGSGYPFLRRRRSKVSKLKLISIFDLRTG